MILLVVDTQKMITKPNLYNFDSFISNIKKLIKVARENDIEVIYVRHDDGDGEELTKGVKGYEIVDDFKPNKSERIFDKMVNSPFKESGLLNYLLAKHVQQIVVVGLQTDYCIDATVKCGFEHGFKMIVPENTNSTVDNNYMSAEETYKYYNYFIWNKRYARCLSMQETIQEMSR